MCRRRLWKRVSLSVGTPLWNLEGGSFSRDFERWMKEGSGNRASLIKLSWFPVLFIRIMLGTSVWGQSRTSVKDLVSPMTWRQSVGHKGPVLRPRCIGTERAQTQL